MITVQTATARIRKRLKNSGYIPTDKEMENELKNIEKLVNSTTNKKSKNLAS